ncbi:hypothetical protein [Haloferula sargassicola]|uniref:Transposase n=1 Tax=Haloferula sargassicola TaxID=490096 RepID=A0ABP9UVK0_9BACT
MESRARAGTELASCFLQLLEGKPATFYDDGINLWMQAVADQLFGAARPYCYHDGLHGPECRRRKSKQIEFTGEMWIGDDSGDQWTEPFWARITDKRLTREGIWIQMEVGEFSAEGDLLTI